MNFSDLYRLQVEWVGWLRAQATLAPSDFVRDDFRERADRFEHDAANVAQLSALMENPSFEGFDVKKAIKKLNEFPFKNHGRGAFFRGLESVRRWISGEETELHYWNEVRASKPDFYLKNPLTAGS